MCRGGHDPLSARSGRQSSFRRKNAGKACYLRHPAGFVARNEKGRHEGGLSVRRISLESASAASVLFLLPRRVVLLEERGEVLGALLVLQAGIDHLGAGNFRARVLDVFEEGGVVPGDARILVGF